MFSASISDKDVSLSFKVNGPLKVEFLLTVKFSTVRSSRFNESPVKSIPFATLMLFTSIESAVNLFGIVKLPVLSKLKIEVPAESNI